MGVRLAAEAVSFRNQAEKLGMDYDRICAEASGKSSTVFEEAREGYEGLAYLNLLMRSRRLEQEETQGCSVASGKRQEALPG